MKKKADLELFMENYLDKELLGEMIDFASPEDEGAMEEANLIMDTVDKRGSVTVNYAFKFKEGEGNMVDRIIEILNQHGYKVRESVGKFGTKKMTVTKK